jgi:hypothetical protein
MVWLDSFVEVVGELEKQFVRLQAVCRNGGFSRLFCSVGILRKKK